MATLSEELVPDGLWPESSARCGDQPDCDPVFHPGTGIQTCIEAAHCRHLICSWKACDDFVSGRIGKWEMYGREVLCGLYDAGDIAGCIKDVNPF